MLIAHLHGNAPQVSVEIGRTVMTLGQALRLGPGSIVELRRLAGEPVDLLAGGKPIAHGEVVVVDEEFALRITEMIPAGAPAVDQDIAVDRATVPAEVEQDATPLPEPIVLANLAPAAVALAVETSQVVCPLRIYWPNAP